MSTFRNQQSERSAPHWTGHLLIWHYFFKHVTSQVALNYYIRVVWGIEGNEEKRLDTEAHFADVNSSLGFMIINKL